VIDDVLTSVAYDEFISRRLTVTRSMSCSRSRRPRSGGGGLYGDACTRNRAEQRFRSLTSLGR
jgi:hypothetical protein